MEHLPLVVVFRKENKLMVYNSPIDQIHHKMFMDNLPEGEKVEVTYQIQSSDKSLGQLAKVHAYIKMLAGELGESVVDMKKTVKIRSGLCIDQDKDLYKSFADCSYQELSGAITACQEIENFIRRKADET